MSNHPKSQAGKGLSVEVRNGDVTRAFRRLKKLVTNEGIIQEVRDRKHFEKPSLKKARAKKAGRKRWLKKLDKMNNNW